MLFFRLPKSEQLLYVIVSKALHCIGGLAIPNNLNLGAKAVYMPIYKNTTKKPT